MIGMKRQNYSVRVTVKKSLKGRHSRFLIPTAVVYFGALHLYYCSVRKVGMEVLKVGIVDAEPRRRGLDGFCGGSRRASLWRMETG